MSSNDPLIEFEKLVSGGHYIEAVNLACELKGVTSKKPFQKHLFGEKNHIFLNALREEINRNAPIEGINNDDLWFCQFLPDENQPLKIPRWFTKIKGHACDWCPDARSRLLKAQILCAKQAILSEGIEPEGCQDLAEKTGFPAGFVCELFHLLKENPDFHIVAQRKIPALLEKGYSAEGQAAYLFIEQIELGIPSEPYPHPIKMSNIPIHQASFQKAIDQAFDYVRYELLKSGDYATENLPVFRWYVKRAPDEKEILALEGPSFYGAFACGMLSLARQKPYSQRTAITCYGNEFGHLSEIGGLAQKCQAACRQSGWNIIIAKDQDTKQGDNEINDEHHPLLLRAKTIEEAMTYLSSGIGFEVINYLDLVYEQSEKLLLQELPPDCPNLADFDKMTCSMKVHIVAGENSGATQDWEKDISEKVKRAVISIREEIGKTRLLRYEGRKMSKTGASNLKEGLLGLEKVNIPIFIECSHLADELKGGKTFEEAIYITLKKDYRIKGQPLSDDFWALIQKKFVNGRCVLLLDDFYRVNKKEQFIKEFNRFTKNYPECRILITVLQVAETKKDDYGELLEGTLQSDEFILGLEPLTDVPLDDSNRKTVKKGTFLRSFFLISFLTVIFIFAVYIIQNGDQDRSGVDVVVNKNGEPGRSEVDVVINNPWYSKAKAAMDSDNHLNARDYINTGLENFPKHVESLALKIKLLLLIGGRKDRDDAKNVADQNLGVSPVLDDWINCLRNKKFFSSIITTKTDFETKCDHHLKTLESW